MKNIFADFRIIDLTHDLQPNIPFWDEGCGFRLQQIKDYDTAGCRVHRYDMLGGSGTHIDAPRHFVADGKDIAALSLESLFVTVRVIDVAKKADQDYRVTPNDIVEHEKNFGKIAENELAIIYTGWSKHWNNPEQYRNVDSKGKMHFPEVSKECAELLVERKIAGIAIDTLSPDCSDLSFPVHHILLQRNIYIIENIANADKLPKQGAYAVGLPLKILAGTESPLRIVGLIRR